MQVATLPSLNQRRAARKQVVEEDGTGTWNGTPKCSPLRQPAMRPAGLLTLNRRSPSQDSDPDTEAFGPGVILAWAKPVKSGRPRLPKPPARENAQHSLPDQRPAGRPGKITTSAALSRPRNCAGISSLHVTTFSCTRSISSSRAKW